MSEVLEQAPPGVAVAGVVPAEMPLYTCYGFVAAAGNVKLLFGYATFVNGKMFLYCSEQIGGQAPQLWRSLWVGKENAAEQVEGLCCDADEYLDSLKMVRRPYEDLGMDDFCEHVALRAASEFH